MNQVFISFSSQQQNKAEEICNYIENSGIRCFISSRDLIPGEEYATQLLTNIDDSAVLLLLLTKASNESPHVLREIEYAVSHKTPILVYKLEEVSLSKSLEYFLMTHQWVNANSEYGFNSNQQLIKSIRHFTDRNVTDNENTYNAEKKDEKIIKDNSVSKSAKESSLKTMLLIASVIIILLLILIILIIQINHSNSSGNNNYTSENSDTAVSGDNDDSHHKSYSLGDTVTLGSYYGEPVEWRIIKINDDNTAIMISNNILSFKIYDAAEGGTYNRYEGIDYFNYENHTIEDNDLSILVRGNNDWTLCNLRTWLNSSSEIVKYSDQAPDKRAAGINFYDTEPGFLSNFSDEELSLIVPVSHLGQDDLVFLLSSTELSWLENADVSIYAKPTDKCIENDDYDDYYSIIAESTGVTSYYWWLRDTTSDKSNEINFVATENEPDGPVYTGSVGYVSYGVRPVICIKLD